MDKLWNAWRAEPTVLIGALRAVLVAGVGFGLDLTAEQITLLILAFEAILTMLTRTAVYAPNTVDAIKAAGAAKVLEAAGNVVVTDAPIVLAETLNNATEVLDTDPDPQ